MALLTTFSPLDRRCSFSGPLARRMLKLMVVSEGIRGKVW